MDVCGEMNDSTENVSQLYSSSCLLRWMICPFSSPREGVCKDHIPRAGALSISQVASLSIHSMYAVTEQEQSYSSIMTECKALCRVPSTNYQLLATIPRGPVINFIVQMEGWRLEEREDRGLRMERLKN